MAPEVTGSGDLNSTNGTLRAALLCLVTLCILALGGARYTANTWRVPHYRFRVIHEYPHDTSAYTEGLTYYGGFLYEGTGIEGRSGFRKVDMETGKILRKKDIESEYYGEGLTVFGGSIFELTWQSHVGFVYDANTFELVRKFNYPGEGWGLTSDETEIFMSDGSSKIRCLDPVTLQETRRIDVHYGPSPIRNINELEYIDGEIYANLWITNNIVRISPRDGHVTGWIDLTGLLPQTDRPHDREAVLNGIAWDATGRRMFVTGKMWPRLFEIQLDEVR